MYKVEVASHIFESFLSYKSIHLLIAKYQLCVEIALLTMDLLAACEALATNVAALGVTDDDSHVSDSDLSTWQALFGFSLNEATKAIQDWRADLSRLTISQSAWLLVKEVKTAEGYNKESYEYSLWRTQMAQKRSHTAKKNSVSRDEKANYLVRLEHGPASSADLAELMRCLPKNPKILTGLDDEGNQTQFCLLSGSQKSDFLNALFKARPCYEPTLIRASVASKELSSTCLYPTLGIDSTLPQFRLDSSPVESDSTADSLSLIRPAQNEYPVWYFFYGTLADPSILSRIIGLDQEQSPIKYKRASVLRGRLRALNEKYLALEDADESSRVDGWAYQVRSQNEEDSLRVYETGVYEVVRCTIEFGNETDVKVQGLTFRRWTGYSDRIRE
ncbi:hypothetical protein HDV63DRAFT_368076 [Trichoderma sp. SZMC 28014]